MKQKSTLIKKIELLLSLLLITFLGNSQVFSSSPTLGVYTSSGSSYSGCTSDGSAIRAKIISYSGTTANIEVRRVNNGSFGSNGTLYLRKASPCNSSSFGSKTYKATDKSVVIALDLSNLLQTQTTAFIPTMVSKSGTRRHTAKISITNACPFKMQWYSQRHNAPWAGDYMNKNSGCTIHDKGCVITCLAMLLSSHEGNSASSYTPGKVNEYLTQNSGYSGCSVLWDVVDEMDGSGKLIYKERTSTPNNWPWLDQQLGLCRKVIVNVNNNEHWVLVIGRTGPSGQGASYKVLNPGNQSYQPKTLADYDSKFSQGRSYAGVWKIGLSYRNSDIPNEVENDTLQIEEYDATYIEEEKTQFRLNVYPNPANSDKITVEFYSDETIHVKLRFTDLSGKVIIQSQFTAIVGINVFKIPIIGLANGVYILSVESSNRRSNIKLQVLK